MVGGERRLRLRKCFDWFDEAMKDSEVAYELSRCLLGFSSGRVELLPVALASEHVRLRISSSVESIRPAATDYQSSLLLF